MFNATSKVADCFSWRRSVSTFSLAKRNGIYRFAALVLSQNGAEAFLYLRWMISFIYHLHLLAVSFHFTFFYLFFFIIIIFFFGRRASRIYLEAVWIIDPILPRGELWQLLLALLESILEFRMVNNRLEFAMLTNSNVNHNRSIVNENLLEWDGTGAVAKSNWINLIWRISFLKNLKKKNWCWLKQLAATALNGTRPTKKSSALIGHSLRRRSLLTWASISVSTTSMSLYAVSLGSSLFDSLLLLFFLPLFFIFLLQFSLDFTLTHLNA